MSSHDFLTMAKEHARTNHGLFSIVVRVVFYSLGVLGAMLVSDELFDGSRCADLSTFMVLTASAELLWNRAHAAGRLWWYVACVTGIAICSFNMMHEATTFAKYQASCGQKPAAATSMMEKTR